MKENYKHLVEYKNVLEAAPLFMSKPVSHGSQGPNAGDNEAINTDYVPEAEARPINISHILGTIPTSEKDRMKRLIFRLSRGNALVYFKDIKDSFVNPEGITEFKTVFFVVFQEGEALLNKLKTACTSFNSRVFDLPEGDFDTIIKDTEKKIYETSSTIDLTHREMKNYLRDINDLSKATSGENTKFYGVSKLSIYQMILRNEFLIYENMNKMTFKGGNIFYGFAWSKLRA